MRRQGALDFRVLPNRIVRMYSERRARYPGPGKRSAVSRQAIEHLEKALEAEGVSR